MTFDLDFSDTHSERGALDTRACYIAANIKHKQNSCHLTRYNDLKVNKKYRRWKMRIRFFIDFGSSVFLIFFLLLLLLFVGSIGNGKFSSTLFALFFIIVSVFFLFLVLVFGGLCVKNIKQQKNAF